MNEGRVLTVAGAKGGVGKSTTSLNLAAALAAAGTSVVLVEADLAMANDADYLSLSVDTDLHEVLAGEAEVTDAIHETDAGFDIVPSGTDIDGFVAADAERLPEVVADLRRQYHLVVVDTGAGIDKAALRALACADVSVLVSTPRVAAVRDASKTVELADRVGGEVAGVVFCRDGTANSPPVAQIADYLGVDLLGHIPEDDAIAAAQDAGQPVVTYAPESRAARAYRDAASRLVRNLVDPSVGGVAEDTGIDEDDLTAPNDRDATQPLGDNTQPASGSTQPASGSDTTQTATGRDTTQSADGPDLGSTPASTGTADTGSEPTSSSPRTDLGTRANGQDERTPGTSGFTENDHSPESDVAGNGHSPETGSISGNGRTRDVNAAENGHAPGTSTVGGSRSPEADGVSGNGHSPETEVKSPTGSEPSTANSASGGPATNETAAPADLTSGSGTTTGTGSPTTTEPDAGQSGGSAGSVTGGFDTDDSSGPSDEPSDEDIAAALENVSDPEESASDGPTDEEIAAAIEQASEPEDEDGPSDEEIAAAIDDAREAAPDEAEAESAETLGSDSPETTRDGPEMTPPEELTLGEPAPDERSTDEPAAGDDRPGDDPVVADPARDDPVDDESTQDDGPALDVDEDEDEDAGFVFPATDSSDADE